MNLRSIPARLARRFGGRGAAPAAATPARQFYKTVWTSLSETESSARIWVQGSDSDALLVESIASTIARLKQTVGIQPTDDILEIGCGVGRLGKGLCPLCKSWTGCDVSPNMLRHTLKYLKEFDNVRVAEVSGYDLQPVADASMDLVYCTVVFMHLSEWDRYNYIEDARRVLRPGGRLYVDNISLTTGYGWKFFQESRAIPPAQRPPQIGSTSTPQEFEVYLQKAGYRDIRVAVYDDAWVVGTARK